jgi:hypothetical protein
MDSRNDEQRRSRFFSPDMMDGEFLPCFLEVCIGLRFRGFLVLFRSQTIEPEAENKECRCG